MAARNLRAAADAATQHPIAQRMGVDEPEIQAGARRPTAWSCRSTPSSVSPHSRRASLAIDAGTSQRRAARSIPLLLHYPYYLLYSSQVVKQADLVFALYLCGDCFDLEQKRRDFVYYEPITVRDSSLSASIQAIVAAEIGHLDLAYDYFRETAFVDLQDLSATPPTACISPHSPVPGWWPSPASADFRDHGEVLPLPPPSPAIERLFSAPVPRAALRVDIGPEKPATSCSWGGARPSASRPSLQAHGRNDPQVLTSLLRASARGRRATRRGQRAPDVSQSLRPPPG